MAAQPFATPRPIDRKISAKRKLFFSSKNFFFFLSKRKSKSDIYPRSQSSVSSRLDFDFISSLADVMGIHNLAKLIADQAPNATKDGEIANYFGRKIAIDASVFRFGRFLLLVLMDVVSGRCPSTSFSSPSDKTAKL